jgi:hypothetical protein
MVGVPKSTGCAICRKRKIKVWYKFPSIYYKCLTHTQCDESWPLCINCQKNGKCCPGPPARHTFIDLGPGFSTSTSTATTFASVSASASTSTSPEEGLHSDTSEAVVDPKCKRLTQLDEKWSKSGAVVHKFRISNKGPRERKKLSRSPRSTPDSTPPRSPKPPLIRRPSPSQHQELSRALIDALGTGSVGHRMSAFGPFIREVPARIGHNAALDAAAACLVNAHSSMVHQKSAHEIANPGLYLRAVQTLQICLEDPQQGMSSNTLCASVLLGLVEVSTLWCSTLIPRTDFVCGLWQDRVQETST